MIFNIKRHLTRYRFERDGYSEVTGEAGKYYTRRGSNTVLFIPDKINGRAPSSRTGMERMVGGISVTELEMES
jgi:hypothetical protein